MVYNVHMRNNLERGAAILDAVMAIAIFIVVFIGFFALLQLGVKTVAEHKARSGALAVARSHIEYIRSLDYAAVGTQSGNPSGNIEQSTIEILNNTSYTITTTITWHDDPGDGIGGADSNPNDYKDISIIVEWPEHAGVSGNVTLSTFVADFEVE